MATKIIIRKINKSAVTGKIVSNKAIIKNPSTTYTTAVKVRIKKK